MDLSSGILDEALERLHSSGPEFEGFLANHGPMAVEALVRHGQAGSVHRWLDHYATKLEEVPSPQEAISDTDWQAALGDPRRVTDWTTYFSRLVAERPWRDVLAEWWPRLLPGIAGAATHPVIRVGHVVRTLLEDGEEAPRVAELAHALGYWAARHTTLPVAVNPAGSASPDEALAALPRIADQQVLPLDGLAQLPGTPGWTAAADALRVPYEDPEAVREQLAALVRAAVHRYLDRGHGNGILMVHTATAPNAVLRTLPALPRELWAVSLGAAWAASAAITSVYGAAEALPPLTGPGTLDPEDVFERSARHGDEHVIKMTDTALDVAASAADGDDRALAAAVRAQRLISADS
ncbi:questin oxidase family protein [Streptomyces chrestomyceticus]|uniref:questin oxidase family protein n=1 Tax=Streptomyces chrestomyceticus TaxID=68185 RepID=UPI0019D25116|nr:questin oxidase family protein [Streptomyces chrestomyceticus]